MYILLTIVIIRSIQETKTALAHRVFLSVLTSQPLRKHCRNSEVESHPNISAKRNSPTFCQCGHLNETWVPFRFEIDQLNFCFNSTISLVYVVWNYNDWHCLVLTNTVCEHTTQKWKELHNAPTEQIKLPIFKVHFTFKLKVKSYWPTQSAE